MVSIVVLDRAPGPVHVTLVSSGLMVLEMERRHVVSSDWVARM